MKIPSPAIIAQSAARRLPKLAMLLFGLAYVLPGFWGRSPWKNADIAGLGAMRELAAGNAHWLNPTLMGNPVEFDALLPYWLGAAAIKIMPFLDPATAVRMPFGLLLVLTLICTWYGVYHLARSPHAQPVAFAFGGEANPKAYASTLADAGFLALLACLGLAQLSHETTPALAQLACVAVVFSALATGPYCSAAKRWRPALSLGLGLVGLALSGAPTVAILLGVGATALEWMHAQQKHEMYASKHWAWLVALDTVVVAGLVFYLNLWRWRIALPEAQNMGSLARLLLWFTWPAAPLALWTLWRWHRQLSSRHLVLPLWFSLIAIASSITTSTPDRSLLLALPALAALAAFSLPTLGRSAASLIDWFTLLFFTGCAFVIWTIWIAMQTGFPQQAAANVTKLAEGFEPSFSWLAFLSALAATMAWGWLVYWRTSRHRSAIWKSLVLPAGGATLCWLLLLTLWLPLLDYARSYAPLSRRVATLVDQTACVEVYGLSNAQTAAFQYHGKLHLKPAGALPTCPWLIVDADAQLSLSDSVNLKNWTFQTSVRRPTDKDEDVLLFKRAANTSLKKRR